MQKSLLEIITKHSCQIFGINIGINVSFPFQPLFFCAICQKILHDKNIYNIFNYKKYKKKYDMQSVGDNLGSACSDMRIGR